MASCNNSSRTTKGARGGCPSQAGIGRGMILRFSGNEVVGDHHPVNRHGLTLTHSQHRVDGAAHRDYSAGWMGRLDCARVGRPAERTIWYPRRPRYQTGALKTCTSRVKGKSKKIVMPRKR